MEVMNTYSHMIVMLGPCMKGSADFWNEVTLFRSVEWEFNSSDSAGLQGMSKSETTDSRTTMRTVKYVEKSPSSSAGHYIYFKSQNFTWVL